MTPTVDNTDRRWLAAYVKMHHEKKVHERLTAQGIQSFVPIQTETRQWSDRKKKVERVLISMMVFVYVNPKEQLQVLQTPSVLRYMVLRGERKPAVIPTDQMDRFRFMVDNSQGNLNFDTACMQVGQEVRVIKGPLTGLVGTLTKIKGKSSIAVCLEAIGFASVEIDANFVEPV